MKESFLVKYCTNFFSNNIDYISFLRRKIEHSISECRVVDASCTMKDAPHLEGCLLFSVSCTYQIYQGKVIESIDQIDLPNESGFDRILICRTAVCHRLNCLHNISHHFIIIFPKIALLSFLWEQRIRMFSPNCPRNQIGGIKLVRDEKFEKPSKILWNLKEKNIEIFILNIADWQQL